AARAHFLITLEEPARPSSRHGPPPSIAGEAVTYQYARALPGFRINAVDPGFTATAINNHTGTSTPAQSAATIVRLALAIDGPSGRLFDSTGEIGW
ncbi:short-chain dehydrogenase, partial [Streptomyces sp. NPDC059122]